MYDYIFKIVVLGDTHVGKSCLVGKFTNSYFSPTHDMTIGVEFATKIIKTNNKDIKSLISNILKIFT